jgi:hypothetical protein
MVALTAGSSQAAPPETQKAPDYVLIGWNNLGMHCINPTYDKLVILPPANTLMAQVIQRGEPPVLITNGVTLTYQVEDNNSSVDRCNFWDFANQLFGVNLPPGVGLTGNRLKGALVPSGDHFEATAIPVLPFNNNGTWNPYQSALVTLKDKRGTVQTTRVVLPVSDELHCDQCHAQDGDGTMNLLNGGTPSIEENILLVHDFYYPEFNLVKSQPVLCSGCHADPALGQSGKPGVKNLSLAMHGWHQQFSDATCYSCHPGPQTHCLRTAIPAMGHVDGDPNCQRCHGTMEQLAAGLENGRQPWAEEPTCAQCHGQVFDTKGALYRESAGHSGVRCATCHNSPHAWWPSQLAADNLQPMRLQGSAKALRDCSICHTAPKTAASPHSAHGPGIPSTP